MNTNHSAIPAAEEIFRDVHDAFCKLPATE
jgi:hypothetical protein